MKINKKLFLLGVLLSQTLLCSAYTNLGNFADNFDPACGTNGSTGSISWTNGWQLTARNTRVVTNNGSCQGEFYGNNTDGAYFSRSFKTPAGTSNLVFKYDYISNGGTYQSQYSTNGGSSWIILATYSAVATQTTVYFTNTVFGNILTTFRFIKTVKGNNSFFFDNVNIVAMGNNGATAAEVLTRAYYSYQGTVIEFQTIEEAGQNPIILYLFINGSWSNIAQQVSIGEGDNTYKFIIPNYKAGDYIDVMIRDDEGIYHTTRNLLIGDFSIKPILMDKNGMWLQWNSIPDKTYIIYRTSQLSNPSWQQIKTCTAITNFTQTFVSYPINEPSGFYKVEIQ